MSINGILGLVRINYLLKLLVMSDCVLETHRLSSLSHLSLLIVYGDVHCTLHMEKPSITNSKRVKTINISIETLKTNTSALSFNHPIQNRL
jgi:hypothetical protein